MNRKELTERCVVLDWNSNWELDLFSFVRNWTDASDFVEVRTSGSTGLPKIIKHTKTAMRESAAKTNDFLGLKPGMSALLCLSTRNIAGMMMVVRTFERDLNLLTVAPDGHPLKGMAAGTAIDFCAMVPAQVYNSLQVPAERRVLESIRHLIIGGAPVSYALLQQLQALPGHVWATFGMTETISHIALRKLNGPDASDAYTLMPGVTMEVQPANEQGATKEPAINRENASTGKLIIHAPYLSADPIITNDVVEITSPRTFRWLGRQDHVINSGGFKIFPEMVEEKIAGVMSRLSGLAGDADHATQRYFIGSIPDEKLGEVPVLVVEMPTPDSLLASLAGVLPRHEVPREILFVEKFIETPTGKIIRSATLKKLIH